MFVPHARVRLTGSPDSPRRRRLRPRRRRVHARECLRMPCLPQTCVVCFLGSLMLLSGMGMSLVGYKPPHSPAEMTDASFNASEPVNITAAAAAAFDARYYALKSLSYLGPVFMGCGLFVIIVAGVLYCEIMDKYVNVVPHKNAKRLPRKELYELIIKEFRKHYFRGIEVPLRKPGQEKVQQQPEVIKMSLLKALSVSTPALLVTPEISRRWQDAQGARLAAMRRYKQMPRLKQLIQDDRWTKTSSLPSMRPSSGSITLEDECAHSPDPLYRGSKRLSKSCTNVLGLFRRSEDNHHLSRSSGFDNPAYNPDDVKRKLLSLPIQREVLGKSLDEALITGVDSLCKADDAVDLGPEVSSNSIPLLCHHPQRKPGVFAKNPRAAHLKSHHSICASEGYANAHKTRYGARMADGTSEGSLAARRASLVVQRASSAASCVSDVSVLACSSGASGEEEFLSGESTAAGCQEGSSHLQMAAAPDACDSQGTSGQRNRNPDGEDRLAPNRLFGSRLKPSDGSAPCQPHRRLSADAVFDSKPGKSTYPGQDYLAPEDYHRSRAYSSGTKSIPQRETVLLKPECDVDACDVAKGGDSVTKAHTFLAPRPVGVSELNSSRSMTGFECDAGQTEDVSLPSRSPRSWTENFEDIVCTSSGYFPAERKTDEAPFAQVSHLNPDATNRDGHDPLTADRSPSLAPVTVPRVGHHRLEDLQDSDGAPQDFLEMHGRGGNPGPPLSHISEPETWATPTQKLLRGRLVNRSSSRDSDNVFSSSNLLSLRPPCLRPRENPEALRSSLERSRSSRFPKKRRASCSVVQAGMAGTSFSPPAQSVIFHQAAVHRPPKVGDAVSARSTEVAMATPPSSRNFLSSRGRRRSVPAESRRHSWRKTTLDADREAAGTQTSREGSTESRTPASREPSAFDSKADVCDIIPLEFYSIV